MLLAILLNSAFADALPQGVQSVYTGVSYGTWSAFESKGNKNSLPQNAAVSQVLSHTQYTYGIQDGIDLSLSIPVSHVSVSTGMVDAVTGIGQLGLASNIDLWQKDSLSLTGQFALSTGSLHAKDRGKLTNIGDGSTQVRAGVTVGQQWSIGSGYAYAGARGWYVFKIPSTFDFDPKYPADDVTYGIYIGGGNKGYQASIFVDGFMRLNGVDYPAPASVASMEGFTALKASQMKVGINDSISWKDWTLSGYIATSVLAKNNPMDEVIGGFGLSYLIQP